MARGVMPCVVTHELNLCQFLVDQAFGYYSPIFTFAEGSWTQDSSRGGYLGHFHMTQKGLCSSQYHNMYLTLLLACRGKKSLLILFSSFIVSSRTEPAEQACCIAFVMHSPSCHARQQVVHCKQCQKKRPSWLWRLHFCTTEAQSVVGCIVVRFHQDKQPDMRLGLLKKPWRQFMTRQDYCLQMITFYCTKQKIRNKGLSLWPCSTLWGYGVPNVQMSLYILEHIW